MKVVFQPPIFRGYVSFREDILYAPIPFASGFGIWVFWCLNTFSQGERVYTIRPIEGNAFRGSSQVDASDN